MDDPQEIIHEAIGEPRNNWAIASLIVGTVAFIFSFTLYVPLPITIPISCPGGVLAWVLGTMGLLTARQNNQLRAKNQAAWGIGLGCATYIVLALLVIAGIVIAIVFGVNLLFEWIPNLIEWLGENT